LLVAFRTPPIRVEDPERPRLYRPLRPVHHISIGGCTAPVRALDSLIDLDSVLPPLCVIWIGWGSDRRPSAISLRRSHVRRNLRHSSKAGHALLGALFCTGLEKVPDGPRGGASAGRPGLGAGETTVRAIGNCYSAIGTAWTETMVVVRRPAPLFETPPSRPPSILHRLRDYSRAGRGAASYGV
jgi:hypothetical protein